MKHLQYLFEIQREELKLLSENQTLMGEQANIEIQQNPRLISTIPL